MKLEYGFLYSMALCATHNTLAPVLETKRSGVGDGIGFWRCPLCLQWHLYLEPDEKNTTGPTGAEPDS
jgi:hypothetical protein